MQKRLLHIGSQLFNSAHSGALQPLVRLYGSSAQQPGLQLLEGLGKAGELAVVTEPAARAKCIADIAGCFFRAACGLTLTGTYQWAHGLPNPPPQLYHNPSLLCMHFEVFKQAIGGDKTQVVFLDVLGIKVSQSNPSSHCLR